MAVVADLDLGWGVRFAITDRRGGVSAAPYDSYNLGDRVGDESAAVAANFALLASEIGCTSDRLVIMNQVHSADVAVVRGPIAALPAGLSQHPPGNDGSMASPSAPTTGDALVTDADDLVLVARGADCAPIMLADPKHGLLGVAHCGRLGLVRGILGAVVAQMARLGAQALVARVGPAICGHCYEVPAHLRDEVASVVPAAAATTRWGTVGVDIGGGALAELRRLGVEADRLGGCTYEDAGLYSYRRDGVTGRHAGLVWRVAG